MSYLYGSIACRRTMLLIMIRIKDVIPGIVQESLKSQVSVLNEPITSPKEKELLLRLFLSSLSSESVLKEIHQYIRDVRNTDTSKPSTCFC